MRAIRLALVLTLLAACGSSDAGEPPIGDTTGGGGGGGAGGGGAADAGGSFAADGGAGGRAAFPLYVNTLRALYTFEPETATLRKVGDADCDLFDLAVLSDGSLRALSPARDGEEDRVKSGRIVKLDVQGTRVVCTGAIQVSLLTSTPLLGISAAKLDGKDEIIAVGEDDRFLRIDPETARGTEGATFVDDQRVSRGLRSGPIHDVAVLDNGGSPVGWFITSATQLGKDEPSLGPRLWELDTAKLRRNEPGAMKGQGRAIVEGKTCEPTSSRVSGLAFYRGDAYAVAGDAIVKLDVATASSCVVKREPGAVFLGAAVSTSAPSAPVR